MTIEELKNAIKNNPNKGDYHFELAMAYQREKRYTLAIKELQEALKTGFDAEHIHKDLGRIYREQGQYDSSMKEFYSALKLNPGNGEINAEIGRVYERTKDYSLAVEEFKLALKKRYDTEDVHKDLGRIYCDQGKYDLAIEELEKAILLGLDNEEVHLKLGWIYRERGEYNLSVKEFKRAIKVSPYKNEPFLKNKILNEIEISQKRTVLKSKFRGLQITLTSKCNLRCIMCFLWQSSWEIPERTVREIDDCIPTLTHLFWQGGEVFLSKYFEPLFDKASQYPYLRQEVNTNGLLIDQKWAEKFVRANLNLIYSIDGTTKKTYEYIRRGARFEDLLKSIYLINEEKGKYKNNMGNFTKMTVSIIFVVMKSNYRELEKTIEFANEYKFDDLTLAPVDIIDEENIFLHEDIEAKRYIERIIPEIQQKASDYGIGFHNWLPPIGNGNKKTEFIHPKLLKREIFCYWPWQHLFIDIEGKVGPNCICLKEVGNVAQSSLEEIWNNDMMQYYRKKILERDYKDLCNKICLTGPEDCMGISW